MGDVHIAYMPNGLVFDTRIGIPCPCGRLLPFTVPSDGSAILTVTCDRCGRSYVWYEWLSESRETNIVQGSNILEVDFGD